MTIYNPDAWKLLKITTPEEVVYKVIGGWYGGYLGADEWRMCSGILRIDYADGVYLVYNHSGSVYHCEEIMECFTGLTSSIVVGLQEKTKDTEVSLEIVNMKEIYEQHFSNQ